jgi:hypothetical protein
MKQNRRSTDESDPIEPESVAWHELPPAPRRPGWDDDAARGCGCLIVLGSALLAGGLALLIRLIATGRLP